MCIQRQRRATRSSRRYPFNENSKHSNRPFRGNYCNDRNRVIHANSLPFVLFFSFFFFHACVQPRSRRAKSRDFFPNKLHRTTRSPFLHVAAYLPNEFLTDPQNFISSCSNLPPRLTSIQFNSSREPSLESTRTVFSPPLFPYFLASYPSEPPSEFFQKSVPTEFHASQKFSPVWRIRLEKYRIKFLSSTCQRLVWTSKWVVSAIVDRSFSQERYYQRRYRLRHVSPTIPEYLSILFFSMQHRGFYIFLPFSYCSFIWPKLEKKSYIPKIRLSVLSRSSRKWNVVRRDNK